MSITGGLNRFGGLVSAGLNPKRGIAGAVFSRSMADAIAIIDTIATAACYEREKIDAFRITDSIVREVCFEREAADAIAMLDAIAPEFGRSAADAVEVLDAIATELAYERSPADAIGTADELVRSAFYDRSASDVVEVLDSIGPEVGIALADAIAVLDALAVEVCFEREAADAAEVLDAIALAVAYCVELADFVGVSDAIGFRRNPQEEPGTELADLTDFSRLLVDAQNLRRLDVGDSVRAFNVDDLGRELAGDDLARLLDAGPLAIPGPADIETNGLGLWLDASQGFTTDGGGVSLFPDQSGNGHDALPGGFAQPQADTFPNGLAGIRFNAANSEALRGESLPSGDPPWTLMVVAIHESLAGFHATVGFDTLGEAASLYMLGNSSGNMVIGSGVNLFRQTPGVQVRPRRPDLLVASWRSPFGGPHHRDWEVNVEPKVTNTEAVPFANLVTVDGFSLGVSRRASPFFYSSMLLGEVCLWTRELTDAERFRERARLNAKWSAGFSPLSSGASSATITETATVPGFIPVSLDDAAEATDAIGIELTP